MLVTIIERGDYTWKGLPVGHKYGAHPNLAESLIAQKLAQPASDKMVRAAPVNKTVAGRKKPSKKRSKQKDKLK